MTPPPPPAPTRSELARNWLRQRIIAGEWPINSRIPSENSLAEELGVARGTVREAVRALTELGMLEAASGRGTFVRSRTPADRVFTDMLRERGPAECIETRAALEADAARRLATAAHPDAIARLEEAATPREGLLRLPGEFHATLVELGCGALSVGLHAALLSALRDSLLRGEIQHALDDDARRADHCEILELIRQGDPAGAAEAASQHALADFSIP